MSTLRRKTDVPADRLVLLDALRGFALLGIMFVNMTWFTGFAVLGPDRRAALGTGRIDAITAWLVHFAVDGKFWSLFALLFGVGFGLLAQRADQRGERFSSQYARRMQALLAIGLIHAIFVWFGDIVSLYAAVALALLLFRRCSERAVLGWAVALLLSPVALGGIWLAIDLATRVPGAERIDP
ncbi:MAG: DUF418 domain-containing protein, partial [Planctomycetota bacterium]